MFENMFGSPRISSQIKNVDGGKVENIGAVVTENPQNSSIQAVTYHYDPADLEAINERDVQLVFVTQKPVGSKYFYRKRLVAPKHHEFYSFMKQPEASSWLRTDKPYFSVYGSPATDLNDAGKVAWDKYQHQTQSIWSDWQQATTVARADGAAGSEVKIASRLPLFSYEKTEIKW